MNPQLPTPAAAADPRQQVLDQIKSSTNVLLTVSENPTVDQLSSVIGMTLLLNKMGKHATAVFSGQVPSTIEFLKPEKTLEKTTDSLRDFIIALDKSKADKLRYKIEDKFVKIFITPYHTSLSQKDLEFSQGDFNVDVVLALGVKRRDDLDKTIIEHGRILHDATVISINNVPGADLGAINLVQTDASGLSEIMVGLAEDLKSDEQKLLDAQISTCFLTGIVAQTDRFSNAKTTPQTMSLAAKLMNAGANQQLIATKLQPPAPIPKVTEVKKPPEPPKPTAPVAPPPKPPTPPTGQTPLPPVPKPAPEEKKEDKDDNGALEVPHDATAIDDVVFNAEEDEKIAKIHIDDDGTLKRIAEEEAQRAAASAKQAATPTSQPPAGNTNATPPAGPAMSLPVVNPPAPTEVKPDETLSDLEKSVNSPHVHEVDQPAPNPALPTNLVGPDKGLPADKTAGSPQPSAPPPVPPPLPSNLSNPNNNIPL